MDFGWFWYRRMFDMRLARCLLDNKNTPQPWRPTLPNGRHGAPPRCRRIQRSANILCAKSMLLKLQNIIVFTIFISYLKARRIVVSIICQGVSGRRPSFLAIHAKLAKINTSTFWGFEPGTNFCKKFEPMTNFLRSKSLR